MVMSNVREQVGRIAAQQWGLVTRADLQRIGVTRGQRRGLLADGTMEAQGSRTYCFIGSPSGVEQTILRACLEAGGAASHRTAAALHGLWAWPRSDEVEILVRRSRSDHSRSGFLVHSTTRLPKADLVTIRGIPCTNLARTLFSLASLVPHEVGVEVVRDLVDTVLRDGKAQERWLRWHFEGLRCRGRPGVATYESILDARANGEVTESWLEREFLRLMRETGLPVPVCQQRIDHRGSFVARVDFSYPAWNLVIEVSGYQHHSSRAQMAANARRRSELQLAGQRVLEFSYDQVVREPEYVVAMVKEALGLDTA